MHKEKRFETMLAISFGLMVFHLIFHVKILLTLAVIIAGIGLLSDFLSRQITWLWLKLSTVLGLISGKILLSIIFYLILTPIAFVMRISGKSAMLNKKEGTQSFYSERNHQYIKEDFENTW